MRIVIDTNVLVSGVLWNGAPHTLLAHVRDGAETLFTSRALMDELAVVLDRDKFGATLTRAQTTRENVLAELRQLAAVIEPQPLLAPVCRDPDDDHVIACALNCTRRRDHFRRPRFARSAAVPRHPDLARARRARRPCKPVTAIHEPNSNKAHIVRASCFTAAA